MKLRQGNSVSTAAITEENFQKVIDAFRMSGCKINAFFNAQNVKYFSFLEWHLDALCKTNEISNFDLLLTVEQILGKAPIPELHPVFGTPEPTVYDFSRTPNSLNKTQQVGRGVRMSVDSMKEDALVLDYSNWHERWEFPPVGTVCEITHNGHCGFWRKVEVLKYRIDDQGDQEDQQMIVIDLSGYADFVVGNPYIVYGIKNDDFKFRPIKSERELAIEEMLPILASLDGTQANAEIACGKLYDLGFRKEGK